MLLKIEKAFIVCSLLFLNCRTENDGLMFKALDSKPWGLGF